VAGLLLLVVVVEVVVAGGLAGPFVSLLGRRTVTIGVLLGCVSRAMAAYGPA
jgi:hypothetical protein